MVDSHTTDATSSGDVYPAEVARGRRPPETSPALGAVEPGTTPAIPEAVELPVAAPVGEFDVPVRPAMAVPELVAERQSPHRPKRVAVVLEEV